MTCSIFECHSSPYVTYALTPRLNSPIAGSLHCLTPAPRSAARTPCSIAHRRRRHSFSLRARLRPGVSAAFLRAAAAFGARRLIASFIRRGTGYGARYSAPTELDQRLVRAVARGEAHAHAAGDEMRRRLRARLRRLDLRASRCSCEGVIRWCERQDRTCLEFRSERTYSGMLPVVISLAGVGTQCANASDPVTPPARAG